MRPRGLTLLEVMLAMAILFIVGVFIMGMFAGGLSASTRSKEYTTALFLAQQKMEETLYQNASSLNPGSGSFTGAYQSYAWNLTLIPYGTTSLKEVEVQVSGPDGAMAHLISLAAGTCGSTPYPLTLAGIPSGWSLYEWGQSMAINNGQSTIWIPGGLINSSYTQWMGVLWSFNTSSHTSTLHTFTYPLSAVVIDASGNLWVGAGQAFNPTNDAGVVKFNSSGSVIAGPYWNTSSDMAPNSLNITPSGTEIIVADIFGAYFFYPTSGTYSSAFDTGHVTEAQIDSAGNIWTAHGVGSNSNTVLEYSSGGALMNTYTFSSMGMTLYDAIDTSGNVWVGSNPLYKIIPSSGTTQGPLGPGTTIGNAILDHSGNVFIPTSTGMVKLDSSGSVSQTYTGTYPLGLVMDASGTVWASTDVSAGSPAVEKFSCPGSGPQYFPYSGPIFPSAPTGAGYNF